MAKKKTVFDKAYDSLVKADKKQKISYIQNHTDSTYQFDPYKEMLKTLQGEQEKPVPSVKPKAPKTPTKSQMKPEEKRKLNYESITGGLDIAKSNKGKEKRLQGEGVDTSKLKDDRNKLEKALNLTPNQNMFFDALELWQRPLNAMAESEREKVARSRDALKQFEEGKISQKEYIDFLNQYKTKDFLKDLKEGIKGEKKTTYSDVLGASGVENKVLKYGGGFVMDVAMDPANALPAGTLSKPLGALLKGANKGLDLVPGVRQGKDVLVDLKNSLFKRGYNAPEEVIKKANKTDADLSYQTSKILDQNTRAVKNAGGLDKGNDVQRVMEDALQINKNPETLLHDLVSNNVSVNRADGEFGDFVKKVNDTLIKPVAQPLKKVQKDRVKQINEQIKSISSEYGGTKKLVEQFRTLADDTPYTLDDIVQDPNILRTIDGMDESHLKLVKDMKQLVKLNARKGKNKDVIEMLSGGLKVKPRTVGTGFDVVNPLPRTFGKVAQNVEKAIDTISPQKTFDELASSTAKPVAEQLLKEGKVTLTKKDLGLVEELKKVFGKDIKILNKKNITVTLQNTSKFTGAILPKVGDTVTNAFGVGEKVLDTRVVDGQQFYKTDSGWLNSSQVAEHPTKGVDDFTFTDRIENVNIPRPERELSKDATINHVAQKMMETNEEIRSLARQYKIPLNEIEGYMAHILSEAEQAARGKKAVASGKAPIGGNKSVVKQRSLDGSVEDVNDLLGKELFNPNAFFSTALGQKRVAEYIIKEGFKREVLNNPSFATKIEKDFDRSNIPKGMVVIKPEQFNFYKSVNPNGSADIGFKAGDEYLVHKGTKQLLENYNHKLTDEGLSRFARGFDKLNEMWKKFALFSTGYHVRNALGNSWNMHVVGMDPSTQAKYTLDSMNDIRLYKRAKEKQFNNVKLSQKESKALAEYDEFMKQGLKGSTFFEADFTYNADKAFANAIKDSEKSLVRKGVEKTVNPLKWMEVSREVGENLDTIQRYSLYKWAKKNGHTTEQATVKVKEALFDYRDLSETERKVFKRIAPFYTFTRKNIPFQLKNALENPTKYSNLDKAVDSSQEANDIDNEILPQWLQDSMAIGVEGDGEGNGKVFNANLPAADLARWSSDPVKEAFGMVNPLGKEAVQQVVGRDFFYDAPIDKVTQGEFLGLKMNSNVEHALEQLGALRNLDKNLKNVREGNLFDPLTGNMFKNIDVKKELNAREWEKKEKLDKLFQQFKKENGRNPKTLKELGY